MTSPESIIPPHRTPAARAEKLIPAVIQLLAVIVLIGLVALLVSALPFRFGETPWRVQVVATFLAAMPQLAFLLSMIAVAGVYAGKHRAVRAAALAFFLLAAVLVILIPLWVLDFLAQRHVQPQSQLGAFTREGLRLGTSTGFLIPFMIWAGIKGWAAGKPDPGAEQGEGHGLIVGQ